MRRTWSLSCICVSDWRLWAMLVSFRLLFTTWGIKKCGTVSQPVARSYLPEGASVV